MNLLFGVFYWFHRLKAQIYDFIVMLCTLLS